MGVDHFFMIKKTLEKIVDLEYNQDELEEVLDVLIKKNLTQGEKVREFEDLLSKYLGVKYCVVVNSGTSALYLALLSLGIEENDWVITTSYSFVATANVIELLKARPIFIDIDIRDFNISIDILEKTLKDLDKKNLLKKVKVILPVHLFGFPVNPYVYELSRRYGIWVLDDAAGALGTKINDIFIGKFADLTCFSFHPRKIITTGEGGCIVTDSYEIYSKLILLRNHGLGLVDNNLDLFLPGFNFRLTEFQAALGIIQLKKIESIINKRIQIFENYVNLFKLNDLDVVFQEAIDGSRVAIQNFCFLLPKIMLGKRDTLINFLYENGVEAKVGTYHIPLTNYYSRKYNYKKGDFPITDLVNELAISIPFHSKLSYEKQVFIINLIKKFWELYY